MMVDIIILYVIGGDLSWIYLPHGLVRHTNFSSKLDSCFKKLLLPEEFDGFQ